MRPGREGGGRRRRPSSSSRLPAPSASLLDRDFATEEARVEEEEEGARLDFFPGYYPRNGYSDSNPRSFPHSVKQQCWEKADKIKGRDPDRWRRDALGNIVFRKLVGCPGCLCHDYDHIIPYSKATVNRSKGNRMEMSKADLIQKSAYCKVSGRDMDLLELSAFGNVRRGQDAGGCRIQ